jgi:hypothetical protein
VDEATRKLVASPRCGTPDGKAADPSEKFAVHSTTWGTPPRHVTWRVMTGGGGLTRDQIRTATSAALSSWGATTSLTFEERSASQSANITIQWAALGSCLNCAIAQSTFPPSAVTLQMNSDRSWSMSTPTPSGAFDVQTVLLHELGHSLGLDHSSVDVLAGAPPVMYGVINSTSQKRSLYGDDKQGISAAYDTWELIPNAQAQDVAVNWFTNPINGVITSFTWHVGVETAPGGFNVYQRSGSSSVLATGNQGAVRIAVDPSGVPWIVNNLGNTYRRTSSSATSGSWTQVPGCASDIGSGPASGSSPNLIPLSSKHIWKIDCTPSPNGYGGTIKKWDHGTSNWTATTSGGNRIAVNSAGIPYVTDIFGGIWSGNSSNPATLGWVYQLSCGTDIAVAGSWLYVIGCDTGVWLRNKQTDNVAGSPPPPVLDTWVYMRGAGTSISADAAGRPYVAAGDASFWRVVK